MWPWEHLALAYLLYSLFANAVRRRPPTTAETIAVVAGSQLPDLVDKPLAWTIGVVDGGYSIGHSAFVAPAVCLAAFAAAVRLEYHHPAGAFSMAYLSHLAADVFYPALLGRGLEPRVVLWPIASPPAGAHGGFLDHFVAYFGRYANAIVGGDSTAQLAVTVGLGSAVTVRWLSDGAPIAADLCRAFHARTRR